MLGFCPHLQDLLLINLDYRLDVKGFLWDTGENTPSIVLYWAEESSKIWEKIGTKAKHHPNDRMTG
jgi:hypothetical protein